MSFGSEAIRDCDRAPASDTTAVGTSEEGPHLTSEVFVIPLEPSRSLVYAPLRRAAFVGNGRLVNLLADVRDGCYDPANDPDGAAIDFFRRLELVDSQPEVPPVTRFSGPPQPTNLTLFLTTACNLRCRYCYASAGDTPLKSMSLATACRGIDFVAANAARMPQRHFTLAYHGGGEPTAHWEVMTASHAYAREQAERQGLTFSAACASNAVLRDDQIDWVIAHLDAGVSVSFDGLPEVHDTHRLTVLGNGSSDRVMYTLRRFDEARFTYGIRVTVTQEHIARLAESIEFICANFKPGRIQVEPAYQLGRWTDAPSAETEAFIAAFRQAQQIARSHGQDLFYSAARVGTLTNHFCGISQDSFALTPDGNVSACYEAFSEDSPLADIFLYGSPEVDSPGYQFKLPVLDNLRNQTVDQREFCRGCFARWHCAGDCLNKSLSVHGRGAFVGSERCHITRELTKDQILDRVARSGGYFWHEPDGEQDQVASQGKELLFA